MKKDNLPRLDQIKKWMQEIAVANGIPREVNSTWRHSSVIWKFAERITRLGIKNGYKIDIKLIKVGCYVHDIGRMVTGSKGSKELLHPILHLFEGYRIMTKWGHPQLARICITHAGGGGIDKVTNKEHGFIARNFFPRTNEEKIIAYADALSDYKKGSGPFIGSYAKAFNRFKKYRGHGKRLQETHMFIKKITKGEIQ